MELNENLLGANRKKKGKKNLLSLGGMKIKRWILPSQAGPNYMEVSGMGRYSSHGNLERVFENRSSLTYPRGFAKLICQGKKGGIKSERLH